MGEVTTGAPSATDTEHKGETLAETSRRIVTGQAIVSEKAPRVDNGPLLQENDLKVYHVRPATNENPTCAVRGMSIVYRRKNRNCVEIATSIVHTNDEFQKHEGTRIAMEHFLSGKTVLLPLLPVVRPVAVRDKDGKVVGTKEKIVRRPVDTFQAIFG